MTPVLPLLLQMMLLGMLLSSQPPKKLIQIALLLLMYSLQNATTEKSLLSFAQLLQQVLIKKSPTPSTTALSVLKLVILVSLPNSLQLDGLLPQLLRQPTPPTPPTPLAPSPSPLPSLLVPSPSLPPSSERATPTP
jgi:hypothetical protein